MKFALLLADIFSQTKKVFTKLQAGLPKFNILMFYTGKQAKKFTTAIEPRNSCRINCIAFINETIF